MLFAINACGAPKDLPPEAPGAPALVAGNARIVASWDPVDGADFYQVWFHDEDDRSLARQFGRNLGSISITIAGLDNDTPYFVWLKAGNEAGVSDFGPSASATPTVPHEPDLVIDLAFRRIEETTPNPFVVTASIRRGDEPVIGAGISIDVPLGQSSAVSDNADGIYEFSVTPPTSGVYPVTVSFEDASIRRDALVMNHVLPGAGQPLLVPGMVNTAGLEDGITITPDGEYLFVQYGPVHFSGLLYLADICSDNDYVLYNLESCPSNADSNWVFDTIGPYSGPLRPGFHVGAILDSKLTHLDISVEGIINGLALFPTVFYGFKKQRDGTFAEPFKVAFDDVMGAQGPFGLSFKMTGPDTAVFLVAWNNYFRNLSDVAGDESDRDKPDIYHGTITMGRDTYLGDVTYSGIYYESIVPHIEPVGFSSHNGVQGNPHLHYDENDQITSIWVDDEQQTHDLAVYVLVSGDFPDGTWVRVELPSRINTPASESQPFFSGSKLYLNRGNRIVYHEFNGTHDVAGYGNSDNWGEEVVVLAGGDYNLVGGILGAGEPTIGRFDGKRWLYFAYVKTRSEGTVSSRFDYNLGAAFVELP